jgi:hypothetical protein
MEVYRFYVLEVKMRKTGWEEPTTGPDWIDVESLMRAIGALHSGHVAVVVSPYGTGATGGLDVAASIVLDVLPGSALPANIVVDKRWPCSTHKTFAAHAFSLLHQLDYEISKVYKQESLWK